MNRSSLFLGFLLLLSNGVLLSACSDSKSPTSASGSCGDENVHCVYATIRTADWTTGVSYLDPPLDQSDYYGSADLPVANIESVSPGDQIYVGITLSPALVVTSSVPSEVVLQVAGLLVGGSEDLSVQVVPALSMQGAWQTIERARVNLYGQSPTGNCDLMDAEWRVTGLSEGDELRGFSVTFTVPESWSNGTAMPASQTMPLERVSWGATLLGDTRGGTPPIQMKS